MYIVLYDIPIVLYKFDIDKDIYYILSLSYSTV